MSERDGVPCPSCGTLRCPCYEAGVRNLKEGTAGLVASVQWARLPGGGPTDRSLAVRVSNPDHALTAAWGIAAALTDFPEFAHLRTACQAFAVLIQREADRRERADDPPAVHHMHLGVTPCRMPGYPNEWPAGHKWSALWVEVTCKGCLEHRPPEAPP